MIADCERTELILFPVVDQSHRYVMSNAVAQLFIFFLTPNCWYKLTSLFLLVTGWLDGGDRWHPSSWSWGPRSTGHCYSYWQAWPFVAAAGINPQCVRNLFTIVPFWEPKPSASPFTLLLFLEMNNWMQRFHCFSLIYVYLNFFSSLHQLFRTKGYVYWLSITVFFELHFLFDWLLVTSIWINPLTNDFSLYT